MSVAAANNQLTHPAKEITAATVDNSVTPFKNLHNFSYSFAKNTFFFCIDTEGNILNVNTENNLWSTMFFQKCCLHYNHTCETQPWHTIITPLTKTILGHLFPAAQGSDSRSIANVGTFCILLLI